MDTGLIVILGITFLLIIVVISTYNGLINKRNQVDNVFASIDSLLKKRYDLIPNLISTVQEYMKHEKTTLTQITELRTKALTGNISNDEKIEINNLLNKELNGIRVAVENYPDLKASQNFIQLQQAMNEVEEQISAARRAFNSAVTDFNNAVQMFPSNIIANIMKFKTRQLFEIQEFEKNNIDAKRLFNS